MSSPILAARDTWYRSDTPRSIITQIEIKQSYSPNEPVDEKWNADAGDTGDITCYRTGNSLIIAGNGSKKIAMNANCSHMFSDSSGQKKYFNALETIDGTNLLDSSNVTTMYAMFNGCTALSELNVATWEVNKVTDMAGMFANCSALVSLAVSNWNTENVETMNGMFQYCSSLTTLNTSNWSVGKVENMKNMFRECKALSTINVSAWDVSEVTDMTAMFYKCSSLEILNTSNWNVSEVTNMSWMFYNCSSLIALDVSSWNTGNVTNIQNMFGCGDGYKSRLEKFVLGENFSFAGNGTCNPVAVLPTPDDSEIITGADGKWYDENRNAYEPGEVSNAGAGTYYASKSLVLAYRTYLIQGRTLVNLAEKIRELTEGKEEITPSQMVNKIQDVQYDAFWNIYQNKGERTDYYQAFASSWWDEETLKPKYDIYPTVADYIFRYCAFRGDMAEHFKNLGRTFSFKKLTGSPVQVFRSMPNVTRLFAIDVSNIRSLNYWYYDDSKLETIDKITLDGSGLTLTTFNDTFGNCYALKNIAFEGTIRNSISFASSLLLTTGAEGEVWPERTPLAGQPSNSVQSIIDALMEIPAGGASKTLTLHQGVRNKLTTLQEVIITNIHPDTREPLEDGVGWTDPETGTHIEKGKGWTLLPART